MNYLILIGKADPIHSLFDRVVVPQVVVKELLHPRTPRAVREWMQSRPEWIEARNPNVLDPTLATSKLGLGEIHAISLALELHATLILADQSAHAGDHHPGNAAGRGRYARDKLTIGG